MTTLFTCIGAFRCGTCLLVIGVANPIHAILLLIRVFFLGTRLLFLLGREYCALLFLIVYVGAIVVLFLFIIRRLERKRVSAAIRFQDLFALRNIVIAVFLLEVLLLISSDTRFLPNINYPSLIERNTWRNFSQTLTHIDSFRALGGLLYTETVGAFLYTTRLLFLARVGGIVLCLDIPIAYSNLPNNASRGVKGQSPEEQALRHPRLLAGTFRILELPKIIVIVSSYRAFRNKFPKETKEQKKVQIISKREKKAILPNLRNLLQNPQRFKYRGGSSYYIDDSQYMQAFSDPKMETEALFILHRESYRKYIRPQIERNQVMTRKEVTEPAFKSVKEVRFLRRFSLIM
jgi:NADH-quinone oxidoreductase subunit J